MSEVLQTPFGEAIESPVNLWGSLSVLNLFSQLFDVKFKRGFAYVGQRDISYFSSSPFFLGPPRDRYPGSPGVPCKQELEIPRGIERWFLVHLPRRSSLPLIGSLSQREQLTDTAPSGVIAGNIIVCYFNDFSFLGNSQKVEWTSSFEDMKNELIIAAWFKQLQEQSLL